MLRAVTLVLLMANLAYYAWTQGYLADLGLAPVVQREPERLKAQVQPDMLRLLNGVDNGAADKAVASPVAGALAQPDVGCWQADGFTPDQAQALRTTMTGLGLEESLWEFTEVRASGRWIVYMGRYSEEQIKKKKEELRELKIEFREVSPPGLGPGLALGTFPNEAAVAQGLKDLTRKGVRTARIAMERPEVVTMSLKLPALTTQQRNLVEGLGDVFAGKKLQACE